MPTKKIRDLDPAEICTDSDHKPPMHMVYSDGVYEHTCPSCGKVTTFTVRNPKMWTGSIGPFNNWDQLPVQFDILRQHLADFIRPGD